MKPRPLSPDEIVRAREGLRPLLPNTPLRRSFALADRGQVFLKLECWQPTGSFKVRGALHLLASLTPQQRSRGVVAASAGNHALGVAFAVESLGGEVPATLFVPEAAPRAKLDKLRSFPVTVRVEGRTYDDAFALATAFAERTGASYLTLSTIRGRLPDGDGRPGDHRTHRSAPSWCRSAAVVCWRPWRWR